MAINKSELKADIIKVLNSMQIEINSDVLDLYIDRTIQSILNYCNLYSLPDELYYTVIDMVVNTCNKVVSGVSGVSSISEGGRSVSFVNKLDIIKDSDTTIIKELNKFKELYK